MQAAEYMSLQWGHIKTFIPNIETKFSSFRQPEHAEDVAGFLLITGLGCLGIGLGLCFGLPLR
jgi:hypothetical protein